MYILCRTHVVETWVLLLLGGTLLAMNKNKTASMSEIRDSPSTHPTAPTTRIMTPEELAWCIKIACARQRTNLSHHVQEQKYVSAHKTALDLHIQGVIGEWAGLEYLGLDKSRLENVSPNSRKCDRGDVIVDGFTVDIKCPQGHHHFLQVKSENSTQPADIYWLISFELIPSSTHASSEHAQTLEDMPVLLFANYKHLTVEIMYQGAVCSSALFLPEHIHTYQRHVYYTYPRTSLQPLHACVASLKETLKMLETSRRVGWDVTQPFTPNTDDIFDHIQDVHGDARDAVVSEDVVRSSTDQSLLDSLCLSSKSTQK